jgi:hypothetical protein
MHAASRGSVGSTRALDARLLGAVPIALVAALSSVACDPAPTGATCRSSAECGAGRSCVDRRCVARDDARLDASASGDAPLPDAPVSDAPLPDAALDAVCAATEARAVEIRRPIDAIVLPDESPSMGVARDAVRDAMETTFRIAMEDAAIDYQVIWNGTTPLPMLEASGRLVRNPIGLGSGDDAMFKPALDSYDAWRPSLREDALKVFVHFTDATSGTGASIVGYEGTFDEVLVAREPALWGTAGDYRFVYHGFVGLTPNTPASAPYAPTDPLVTGSCSGSFANPRALQEMAIRTGGLRYPLCDAPGFDAVFRAIAEAAIERAAVSCALELPEPPMGMTLDLATLAVRYESGGASEVLLRAADAGACNDASFLLEADRVVLCPAACVRIEADPAAVLTLLTGCDPELY